MTVLSGSQGALRFRGVDVARCRAWEMNFNREALDTTSLCITDATAIYGRAEGRGTATVLYDPDDTAAVEMFNSVFADGQSEDGISFVLDDDNGVSYNESCFVESVSPSVQVGNAHACRVTFRISDTAASIVITGPDEVALNSTRLYLSTVLGVPPQTITYLWTSMGATFDDPTKQNPLVTFDTAGTTTLKVTATLEDSSTLEATIDVNVSVDPIFFAIRPRLPLMTTNRELCAPLIDEDRGFIYYVWLMNPFNGDPDRLMITKVDTQGTILGTYKIIRNDDAGEGTVYVVMATIRPSTGDIYLAVSNTTGATSSYHLFRISSDGVMLAQAYNALPSTGITYKVLLVGNSDAFANNHTAWLDGDNLLCCVNDADFGNDDNGRVNILDADTLVTTHKTYRISPQFTGTEISVTPGGKVFYTGDYSGGKAFYEIDLGADPLNSITVNGYLYTSGPTSFMGWTPTGYYWMSSGSNTGIMLLDNTGEYNVVDYFTYKGYFNNNSPGRFDQMYIPAVTGSVNGQAANFSWTRPGTVSGGFRSDDPSPNYFGTASGLCVFSDDMRQPQRYINFCENGGGTYVSRLTHSSTGKCAAMWVSTGSVMDERIPSMFFYGDINANAGQYDLEMTQDDDAPSVTASMQIADLNSFTPVLYSVAIPGKTTFNATIVGETPNYVPTTSTVYRIDITSEITYETQVQFP